MAVEDEVKGGVCEVQPGAPASNNIHREGSEPAMGHSSVDRPFLSRDRPSGSDGRTLDRNSPPPVPVSIAILRPSECCRTSFS